MVCADSTNKQSRLRSFYETPPFSKHNGDEREGCFLYFFNYVVVVCFVFARLFTTCGSSIWWYLIIMLLFLNQRESADYNFDSLGHPFIIIKYRVFGIILQGFPVNHEQHIPVESDLWSSWKQICSLISEARKRLSNPITTMSMTKLLLSITPTQL